MLKFANFGLLCACCLGCIPANPVASNNTVKTVAESEKDRGALADDFHEPDEDQISVLESLNETEEHQVATAENIGESEGDHGTFADDADRPGDIELEAASTAVVETSISVTPRPAWTTSHVHGAPDRQLPYEVEEVFDGLSFYAPVCIQQIPGTEKYLIGELCGRIYSIDKNAPGADPELAIDLVENVSNRPPVPARGQPPATTDNPLPADNLYDFAFHPDFESNRQIFVTYLPSGDEHVTWLSRMELSADNPPRVLRESETRFLSWPSTGHNGGCIRFGPDGYLYISTGDGVGPNPPDKNNVGQDISNLLASVLRIDVNNTVDGRPYAIPSDNPFIDTPDARPEVWAYGFRNPWKMDFDRNSGMLWVGDVGWETWEMVHQVTIGGNYGWPVMEGRKPLRSEVEPGPTPIIPPVKDYPRSEANSVTGGIVYSGKKFPELAGWFIHGDYRTGHIWALKLDDQGVPQHRHLARSSICIIAFMETLDGEIYVMDHDMTGRTYRLVPSTPADKVPEFPQDLAATGLFANVADLQPAPGVIPYQVTVEHWLDGAYAERLLALPGKSRIVTKDTAEKSHWEFPAGTVLAQTVYHQPKPQQEPVRLETRLLHFESDRWRAYSYRWNESQTNAFLAESAGELISLPQDPAASEVPIHDSRRILSRAECVFCHRNKVGSVLGFVPAQLDRWVNHGGFQHDQLKLLAEMGLFDGDPRSALDEASRLVDPRDSAHDLNARARSYLDVNCGICHNPQGESIAMFYLRRHYSLEDAKVLNKVSIGAFGLQDPHLIVPGDPYRSVVLYRLAKLGNARMPYVGSYVVDPLGFQLIHDWIASLEGETTSLLDEDRASLEIICKQDVSSEDRNGAVSQLLGTTGGALALLSAVRGGQVGAELHDQIIQRSQKSPAAAVRSLFEDFVPESQRRPTLGNVIQPEVILELTGHAALGKLIYLSDSNRCRTCHAPNEQGRTLGAELKEIGKKYAKPELLRHILEPSLKMEPKLIPYRLETTAGRIYTGLIAEQSEDEIVLQTANREVIHISTDDVETLEQLEKSIMPDRLLSDMTAQEAADLLEYLSTLRGEN